MLRTLSILRLSGFPIFGSGLNAEDGIRIAASVMAVGLCCADWLWGFAVRDLRWSVDRAIASP